MPKLGKSAAKGSEWDDLRFVLAIARTRSISGAARSLGVDHATVARRADRLSGAFNTKLFDRTRAGYLPTAAGRKVVELAEMMESALLRCESEIADRNEHLVGTVRVGAPDGIGSMFLAAKLASLCNLHPELEIQIVTSPRSFSLAKREVDIVLTLEQPANGRLAARKLTDFSLHLCASRAFIAANGMPETLDDLRQAPTLGYIEGFTSPPLDFLPLIGKGEIKAKFKSTHILSQLEAVRAGAGIAILPDFMVEAHPDIVPVLPDQFSLVRTFYMVVHEDSRRLVRIQAVAEFIQNEVRKARHSFMRE